MKVGSQDQTKAEWDPKQSSAKAGTDSGPVHMCYIWSLIFQSSMSHTGTQEKGKQVQAERGH